MKMQTISKNERLDLSYFRALLEQEKNKIEETIQIETEVFSSSAGSNSDDDLIDRGARTEQETILLGIIKRLEKKKEDILDALSRIDQKKFGICEITGKQISKERLEKMPWARMIVPKTS